MLEPQCIGFITAFILSYMIDRGVWQYAIQNKLGFVISLIGMNFAGNVWNELGIQTIWLIGEWFTSVILTIYGLFPLLRKLFCAYRWIGTFCLFVLFFVNLQQKILTGGGGYFSYSNGIMFFWTGMLFAEYKDFLRDKVYTTCGYYFLIIGIGLALIFPAGYFSVYIFSVLLFIFLYRFSYSSYFTQYVCKYNYEIYLVHHRIYLLTMPFWLSAHSNATQLLCAFFVTVGLSFVMAKYLQIVTKKAENSLHACSGFIGRNFFYPMPPKSNTF